MSEFLGRKDYMTSKKVFVHNTAPVALSNIDQVTTPEIMVELAVAPFRPAGDPV